MCLKLGLYTLITFHSGLAEDMLASATYGHAAVRERPKPMTLHPRLLM